ncbi:serine/threonine-protein kinase [Nocardia anaemiae]|uniref:serine/threonine-protein kinase n=1 Tax=Nocardia anaemiae TaxID=263910 RepID=UPI0007A41F85|nr:serine/threonine-protein kinase [Nocardia anaemiae]
MSDGRSHLKGVALLNSGEVFAGFTVERLLGQGGMGSVYLARHPRLGKQTALKLLNRELFADAEVRARFEREADLAAHLDHPNIVAVYDRGSEDNQLWISMQYIDGVDAATVDPMTLPPERAVQIIEGVAAALDYAHGMGVLHRDVKPANFLLARSSGGQGERVFLTDFGIARLREDSTHLTQTGMFSATLSYASPEQMTGAELDNRTDQYSLACALYWLFTGMAPFDAPDPNDIIRGHLQHVAAPLATRRQGLNPALDGVLAKAMAKRPEHRYATCAEFAAAARKALTAPPVATVQVNPGFPPGYPGQAVGSAPFGGADPGAFVQSTQAVGPAGYGAPQGYPPVQQPMGPGVPAGYPAQQAPPGAPAQGSPAQGAPQAAGYSMAPAQPDVATTQGPPQAAAYPEASPQSAAPQAVAYPAAPQQAVPPQLGTQGPPAQGQPMQAPAAQGSPIPAQPTQGPPMPGQPTQQPPGAAPHPFGPNAVGPQPTPDHGRNTAVLVGWIAVGIVVAVVVVLGTLVVVGWKSEGPPDAAVPPPATSTTAAAASDALAKSRRLFPNLVPQGKEDFGEAYQDARCMASEAGEPLGIEDEPLKSSPWVTAWECHRETQTTTQMSYTIIEYASAADARAVVQALPANVATAGKKSGIPVNTHRWTVEDPPGPLQPFYHTAKLVVSFESDPARANFLVYVSNHGTAGGVQTVPPTPTAQDALTAWWDAAPL